MRYRRTIFDFLRFSLGKQKHAGIKRQLVGVGRLCIPGRLVAPIGLWPETRPKSPRSAADCASVVDDQGRPCFGPQRKQCTKIGIRRNDDAILVLRALENLVVACSVQTIITHMHRVVAGLVKLLSQYRRCRPGRRGRIRGRRAVLRGRPPHPPTLGVGPSLGPLKGG